MTIILSKKDAEAIRKEINARFNSLTNRLATEEEVERFLMEYQYLSKRGLI